MYKNICLHSAFIYAIYTLHCLSILSECNKTPRSEILYTRYCKGLLGKMEQISDFVNFDILDRKLRISNKVLKLTNTNL